MQAHGRQAKRVAERRRGGRQVSAPAEMRFANESVSAGERRQARWAATLFVLAFTGICAAFVILTWGEVFG